MIKNFPIIDCSDQAKNYKPLNRRDVLNTSKLEYFRDKMRTSGYVFHKQQVQDVQKNCISLFRNTRKKQKDWINSHSLQKCKNQDQMSNMSNPSIKKNKSGFSKVFNRSKTDWDHNFVGDKYIKRIKYQINNFKNHSLNLKDQQTNKKWKTVVIKQKKRPMTKTQVDSQSFNLNKLNNLSNQQLERIKQMKIKRRFKSKLTKNPFISVKQTKDLGNRNRNQNRLLAQFQRLGQPEPWARSPSNFSSLERS